MKLTTTQKQFLDKIIRDTENIFSLVNKGGSLAGSPFSPPKAPSYWLDPAGTDLATN